MPQMFPMNWLLLPLIFILLLILLLFKMYSNFPIAPPSSSYSFLPYKNFWLW
uniref:ATP synthase F0 subunit 8 n=1 Tax=Litostrophus scaber TaxID=2259356 RepID=UPI00286AD47F|nr:ATP synthase F0 subunit 8 [Litostrophus scaber]WKF19549.1 ATP synthase subunit 8 [Litostrophus scaber]